MPKPRVLVVALLALVATVAAPAPGQGRPDPNRLITAQRDAMKQLAFMDGVWKGPAWSMLPTGEKHHITQTERIGTFLDGTVRVIEGRGYEPDGTVAFNALGIISYDAGKKAFSMRSYAMGRSGDYVVTPTENGFSWEIPAGPMTIRYTAVIEDGTWHETGDRVMVEQEPVRFFEMTLSRIGDSTWPAGGAVPPE